MTSIEVRLEEADVIAAYRLMGRRSRRQARPLIATSVILAAIVVALLVMFPDARLAFARSPLLAGLLGAVLLLVGLLIALLAATPALIRRAARNTLKQHPGMAEPIAYTLDDDRLGIRTAYSEAAYPWGKLHGWREDERIVLILLTRQQFYVVPKVQVDADALDALRARLGPAMS